MRGQNELIGPEVEGEFESSDADMGEQEIGIEGDGKQSFEEGGNCKNPLEKQQSNEGSKEAGDVVYEVEKLAMDDDLNVVWRILYVKVWVIIDELLEPAEIDGITWNRKADGVDANGNVDGCRDFREMVF